MKKFLSYCLVAVMLVSAFAVGASALSWSAGEGFKAFAGESYSNKEEIGPSPVEFTDNGNSVVVKQGGYFDGANINAGVRTNEKVGLDGLEVTVEFAKAPIATQDCWFAIHLMQKPELFTANPAKMEAENMGYVNLIRFGDPKLEMYTETFTSLGATEIGANDNMFAIKTGDKLTMKVEFKYGQYVVTYDHNGKVMEVPTENTLSLSEKVFADDGMAHVVVTGSLLGADNDWEYTVTVKEGEGLSEEKKANAEFQKGKKVVADEFVANEGQIAQFEAEANGAVEGKNYAGNKNIEDAFAVFAAAKASVAEAKALLDEAKDDAAIEAAKAVAGDAVKNAREAKDKIVGLATTLVDAGDEVKADEGETTVDIVEEENEGNMLPLIIAIVAVVIVVIAIVAVVLGKKKKN